MSADRPDALERQPRATGGSTFDRIKTTVAEKLRAAAHTVEEKSASARGRSEGLSSYGHQAAGWLDKSANYIEEADPQRIKSDIENQVRSNPGRSLLIAGAVGLFLGTLLRRR
ncbi:MAG TPA: hypothetical protein VNO70_13235 [Blastocatellia bacterium]|nr:hypothetical protein [Blastocatellia bacterium]